MFLRYPLFQLWIPLPELRITFLCRLGKVGGDALLVEVESILYQNTEETLHLRYVYIKLFQYRVAKIMDFGVFQCTDTIKCR